MPAEIRTIYPEITDQQVHEILSRDFTDRYRERSGMDKFAHSMDYDPANPYCDYSQTSWEAKPRPELAVWAAKFILGKMHRMSFQDIEDESIRQFDHRTDDISAALQEYPVMLVNGHSPDLSAALTLFSAGMAIARNDRGRFHKNYREMIRISHAIGTRGFGPLVIGRRERGPKIAFVDVARWVLNPHLSFPDNQKMRESELPASFKSRYNDVFKEECIEAVQFDTRHPKGYHSLWSTPPAGTQDLEGYDFKGNSIVVTAPVGAGTIKMIRDMGVGLLPIRTRFGRLDRYRPSDRPDNFNSVDHGDTANHIELGRIIPPSEVNDETLHEIMEDLADFRTRYGGMKGMRVLYARHPDVSRRV